MFVRLQEPGLGPWCMHADGPGTASGLQQTLKQTLPREKKKKKKVPVDSRQMHNRRYSESLLMPLFPNPRIRWTEVFTVRSGPSRHCWWSHPHACPDRHWVAFCLLQKWAKSRCTFPYVVLLQSSFHRCKMRVDLLMMPISYKLQHARKKIIFTAT